MNKTIQITEVNIVPVKPNNGLIGFASFVVDENFYVGNVAIFSRLNGDGLRLVYPRKGEIDCFHPIKREVGDFVEQIVKEKFHNLLRCNEKIQPTKNPQ
jgi:stage V sporulation protein G